MIPQRIHHRHPRSTAPRPFPQITSTGGLSTVLPRYLKYMYRRMDSVASLPRAAPKAVVLKSVTSAAVIAAALQ